MQFRPCIDLHEGRVKQIVGATLRDDTAPITNFETVLPASHFALQYKADNLVGGHIIMLGENNHTAALSALHAYPNGMQIGGGITDKNAMEYLDNGASHVIVTSYVFKDGEIVYDNLRRLNDLVGKKRVVLDLSCKKKDGEYFIVTNRWQKFTNVTVAPSTFDMLSDYCDEFLVHAADVEGKRGGVDEELIAILANWNGIPITYAGGVATLSDLMSVKKAGKEKIHITVGSALDIFGGVLLYRDVVKYCSAGA